MFFPDLTNMRVTKIGYFVVEGGGGIGEMKGGMRRGGSII
jgi:hypothetical protein